MRTQLPPSLRRMVRASSPGISIACAVLCVLSATAVAFAAIGSPGITNGSIRGIDIRNGSISGTDVANGSLGPRELATGTADFTKAYTVGTTTSTALENDADGAALLSRSLPAGSYTFVATVDILNTDQGQVTPLNSVCEITVDGAEIANGAVRLFIGDEHNFGQVTILGSARLTSPAVAGVRCYGPALTQAQTAKLMATKVGSLSKLGTYLDLY